MYIIYIFILNMLFVKKEKVDVLDNKDVWLIE